MQDLKMTGQEGFHKLALGNHSHGSGATHSNKPCHQNETKAGSQSHIHLGSHDVNTSQTYGAVRSRVRRPKTIEFFIRSGALFMFLALPAPSTCACLYLCDTSYVIYAAAFLILRPYQIACKHIENASTPVRKFGSHFELRNVQERVLFVPGRHRPCT